MMRAAACASANACVRRRISANRYAARRFRKCSLIRGMARPQYNPPPRAWHLEVAMVLREDNVIETVGRPLAALRAVRLAPLAGAPVAVLPVPAGSRRDPGG